VLLFCLLQIALQTQGNIYEDVPLVEGQEIKPSMFIDLDHEYMYVMTDHKVSNVKVISYKKNKHYNNMILF
jgi:hypothetical protein